MSKILNPAERRYSTTEREMMAIRFGCKRLRQNLKGRKFEILTQALVPIMKNLECDNERLARMRNAVSEFDAKLTIGLVYILIWIRLL